MSWPPARGAAPTERIGVRRLRGVAELTSLAEVRAAAKDWVRFSSRLQGDPPEHGTDRALLDPLLGRRAVAALEPAVRSIARELIAGLVRRGGAEAVHELAVPMVATVIAHAFGRPGDAAELTSWGITSWEDRPDGTRSGALLDAYVARVLDEGAGRGWLAMIVPREGVFFPPHRGRR